MSLVRKRIGKQTYLYFKMTGPKEIYLGPEDRPDPAKVRQAVEYVRKRITRSESLITELLQLGYEEERRRPEEPLPEPAVEKESPPIDDLIPTRLGVQQPSSEAEKRRGKRKTSKH